MDESLALCGAQKCTYARASDQILQETVTDAPLATFSITTPFEFNHQGRRAAPSQALPVCPPRYDSGRT